MSDATFDRSATLAAREAPHPEPETDPMTDPWGMNDPTVPAPVAALLCAGAVLAVAVAQLLSG
ncbi:hypothetical protein [Muricoccus radiodurans]|uniref:hypothetical protein n=1 Tax=Muricoccus radiodurans TaxID=2231721 RepID=UPI003CF7796C